MAGFSISGAEPPVTDITALFSQVPLTMPLLHLKTDTVDQKQFTKANNLFHFSWYVISPFLGLW
jgi:hypothetical protein